MKHRFKNTCYSPDDLLNKCTKLSTFMTRLVKQSASEPDMWDPALYRGDGFEAFVETLIKLSPIDKRINIVEYSPWDIKIHGPDMGIDGLGVSHNGHKHSVQIKFRANTQIELTANEDHISNFVAKTLSMYQTEPVNMTLFTTAKSLKDIVNEQMYHGQVRTLGYKELSKLVDDNIPFWTAFRAEFDKTR